MTTLATDDLLKANLAGAAIGVALRYGQPTLDRARYTLSRGEATADEQRVASALLEALIGAINDR